MTGLMSTGVGSAGDRSFSMGAGPAFVEVSAGVRGSLSSCLPVRSCARCQARVETMADGPRAVRR